MMKIKSTFAGALLLATSGLFAQVNLDSGLVAHYPMDGNINDVSPNAHHGTVNGATLTTDRNGKANSAYSFDGVSNWIELQKFNTGTTFTVAFWVNSTDTARAQAWVTNNTTKGSGAQADNLFHSGSYQSKVSARVKFDYRTFDTISSGWKHYAIVCQQITKDSSRLIVYKNGKLKLDDTINSVFDTTATLAWSLGQDWDYTVKSDFFKGSLDEVWIFKKVLSKDEVNNLISPVETPGENTIYACEGVDAIFEKQDNTMIWYSADLKNKLATDTYNAGKLTVGTHIFYASQVIGGIESVPTKQTVEVRKPEIFKGFTGEDTIIISKNVTSEVYLADTVWGASSYKWSIIPDSAGTITGTATKAVVDWKAMQVGEAKLKVILSINCIDTLKNTDNNLVANAIESAMTKTIKFVEPTVISVCKEKSETVICVSPNPSNGTFSVSIEGANASVTAKVFDESGNFVKTLPFVPGQEIISGLKAGNYFLFINADVNGSEVNTTGKIIVK